MVADGGVAVAAAVVADVVKPIRQRRALGMANEIKSHI
jgi:hypothetical protein